MKVYTRETINEPVDEDILYCLNDLVNWDHLRECSLIWKHMDADFYVIRIFGMGSGEILLFDNNQGDLNAFNMYRRVHNGERDMDSRKVGGISYDPKERIWIDVTDRTNILFEVIEEKVR